MYAIMSCARQCGYTLRAPTLVSMHVGADNSDSKSVALVMTLLGCGAVVGEASGRHRSVRDPLAGGRGPPPHVCGAPTQVQQDSCRSARLRTLCVMMHKQDAYCAHSSAYH